MRTKELTHFSLRLKFLKRLVTHRIFAPVSWSKNNFRPPSPYYIKKMILLNNAVLGAPWIETGTYLGETTSFLGRHFPLVVTLEPSKIHFTYNQRKFRNIKTIEVINKSSEEAFSEVIKRFKGAINIYLDGHSSGDGTFCGVNKTPVRIELEELEKNLSRFHDILIAIDDFRVFGSYESIYPSNFFLVDFCERNNLSWTVEHDLFLCSRRKQK